MFILWSCTYLTNFFAIFPTMIIFPEARGDCDDVKNEDGCDLGDKIRQFAEPFLSPFLLILDLGACDSGFMYCVNEAKVRCFITANFRFSTYFLLPYAKLYLELSRVIWLVSCRTWAVRHAEMDWLEDVKEG